MDIADLPDEPDYLRNVRKTLDELNKPLKAVELALRPFRQWESLQRQLEPIRRWEELQQKMAPMRRLKEIERQLAPYRQWEEIQRQLAPYRHWEEMQRQLAPARRWEEMQKLADLHAQRMMFRSRPELPLGASHDTLREVLNAGVIARGATAVSPLIDRISQQGDWLERIQRQATGGLLIRELGANLERANPTLTSLAAAQTLLDGLRASFEGRDHSSLNFGDENVQQAEDVAEQIAETSTSEQTLNATFVQIAVHIQAQPDESVQLVLWAYFKKIVEFIVNAAIQVVITYAITQHMLAAPTQTPPQTAKTVIVAARAAIGSAELLSGHRFVSAKSVNVRLNPNARSPKLAELQFGTAVKLLKQDRDFSLVIWSDTESGAEIQGWVFARYLKKFD
jgi:hypothetical protein